MNTVTPYSLVESWLQELPEWKSRLETLQAQLTHLPGLTQKFDLVAIHGQGQKNEAILHEVIKRIQFREVEIPFLQLKIQVLEMAIHSLTSEEQIFIEQRYVLKLPTPLILEKLNIPSRSYYRLRRRTLDHIYRIVGGADSILGLGNEILFQTSGEKVAEDWHAKGEDSGKEK
ncbi:hypothetical protein [Cohnella zeiphila]|uniref:Uncharacterized protein n=1 Tax=Cohnella zeiphila TaxID=2761120 RepID=A0A7X0VWB7_9BACL|nr:hypothetical protein [Cohnella zeiphila]MBB6732771.1 hypothetical protein [Cohnella zeiphila]